MKVSTWLYALHPRSVFRTSRAARRETTNVFLRVERGGIAGYGEASVNAYYGENAADVAERLGMMNDFLLGCALDSPKDIAVIWEEAWAVLMPSRAAQCALDVALWDWLAKREQCPVTELALGAEPRPVESFATIGISEPGEVDEKIKELNGYPRVKVKAGRAGDLSTAARVRAALPDASIAVDANCAWTGGDLLKSSGDLAALWIEFVEQPLPPECDKEMRDLAARVPVPVLADESCVTPEDVERMRGSFAGFNIKLVKCGGLTPALRMARRGRELGLRTMVGCMLESSLLISAGAVAAQITDYADLDGAWLLGDDPARGWQFDRGMLRPPYENGLGVRIAPPVTSP
ncbi:MAG TPA: dipeptide epimerase [Chthoniobacteraceae bacterium]|nr:dipeptide epimerase [Chthoniobacteraceae bacterium]